MYAPVRNAWQSSSCTWDIVWLLVFAGLRDVERLRDACQLQNHQRNVLCRRMGNDNQHAAVLELLEQVGEGA